MTLSPSIIYITLHFTDSEFDSATAYLNNTPNIIDPYKWVLASKGKGYLLQRFAYNYQVASLGTLNAGVHYANIDLDIEYCPAFRNASDSFRLTSLGHQLSRLVSDACKNTDQNSEACSDFKICQSYLTPGTSFIFYYTFLLLHQIIIIFTRSRCWSLMNTELIDLEEDPSDCLGVLSNDFLHVLVIVLLVFYFPLIVLSFTTQKKAPIRLYDSLIWLGYGDSVPIGLKYLLFSRKSGTRGNRIGSLLRLLLIIIIVLVFCSIDLIVMYLTADGNNLQVVWQSAFRYLIDKKTHLIILGFIVVGCFTCAINLSIMNWREIIDFDKTVRRTISSHKRWIRGIELCLESFVEVQDQASSSWAYDLMTYMKLCLRLPVTACILDFSNLTAWKKLTLPFHILYSCCVCSPIAVMVPFILQFRFNPWSNTHHRRYSYLIFSMEWLFVIFSVLILCKVACSCAFTIVYFITYTLAGLVLNFSDLDPKILLTFAIFGYTISQLNIFYDKYFHLKQIIIREAKEIDRSRSGNYKPSSLSVINTELFWYVVDHLQPWGFELLSGLCSLLIKSGFLWFGYSILNLADAIDQISDTSKLIYAFIIPLVVPLLRNLACSKSDRQASENNLVSRVHSTLSTLR